MYSDTTIATAIRPALRKICCFFSSSTLLNPLISPATYLASARILAEGETQ